MWEEETFRLNYRKGEISYGKNYIKVRGTYLAVENVFKHILRYVDIAPGARVGFVGVGYGYLLYQFAKREYSVWGTDTSAWIHRHKEYEAPALIVDGILNLDITIPADRDELPFSVDWLITEDIITGMPESEHTQFLSACALLCQNVLHIVTSFDNSFELLQGDLQQTHKLPLAEWRRKAVTHNWMVI